MAVNLICKKPQLGFLAFRFCALQEMSMDIGMFSQTSEGNTEHLSLVHFSARSEILETLFADWL